MSKPLSFLLRLRACPDARFVSVWLVRRQGSVDSCVLFGEMLPQLAEELATALELEVEREEWKFRGLTPQTAPGCVGVEGQRELFGEAGQ